MGSVKIRKGTFTYKTTEIGWYSYADICNAKTIAVILQAGGGSKYIFTQDKTNKNGYVYYSSGDTSLKTVNSTSVTIDYIAFDTL